MTLARDEAEALMMDLRRTLEATPHYHVIVTRSDSEMLTYSDGHDFDGAQRYIDDLQPVTSHVTSGIWVAKAFGTGCPLAHGDDPAPDDDAERAFLSEALSAEPVGWL